MRVTLSRIGTTIGGLPDLAELIVELGKIVQPDLQMNKNGWNIR